MLSVVFFGNCGKNGINSLNKRNAINFAVSLAAEVGGDCVAIASWLASSKLGIRMLSLNMAMEHKV